MAPGRNAPGTWAPLAVFGLILYAACELSVFAPSKTDATATWPSGPPIYHHLIYIKVLSPLIAKTNKQKAASIMEQQQAGCGGCEGWGPVGSKQRASRWADQRPPLHPLWSSLAQGGNGYTGARGYRCPTRKVLLP